MVIIFLAITFEVNAQVKQWSRQAIPFSKEQSHKQASYSAITIQKWMECLELVMNHRRPRQDRYVSACMDELLQTPNA